MLIIGQVNEFTSFTETGNFRLFSPPMMQIVRHEYMTLFIKVLVLHVEFHLYLSKIRLKKSSVLHTKYTS